MRSYLLLIIGLAGSLTGCNAIPDMVHQPLYHNPFPQLERVAVLPFNNLSDNPHVDGEVIARSYFQELQKIPGFSVMPLERVKTVLRAGNVRLETMDDIRELGRQLGVDAVVVGAVTDYDPYYPPRLGLAVDWYATNPGFHPIPPGYGLPWGRPEEKHISTNVLRQAEFALAKQQLRTQTPDCSDRPSLRQVPAPGSEVPAPRPDIPAPRPESLPPPRSEPSSVTAANHELAPPGMVAIETSTAATDTTAAIMSPTPGLPPDWPDPRGFIPPPPGPVPPPCLPHYGPIIEQVRLYDGKDSELTKALANYFYFADDARFGGWQAYLQRSEDFIRFCCYQSITEMLELRGGGGETRVVIRWPIGRYER